MLAVNYKNENMSGFVSDCLKDEEKKGLFILEFPVKRQGSPTGKILTDWQTLDDLELVLTIQKNGIQYIRDLYNNTYILKEDGSVEAINTNETKDATFVAVDVIQSFSNLEMIRRCKKYFKKLFFVSTRSAMSVYYKKFYQLDVKTQKIKKEITKNTKENKEFTEDANYLTGVYVMQDEEIEMPSIEFTAKEEEMPSIEVMTKEEEMPSIEVMTKEEIEMPSIEVTAKEEDYKILKDLIKKICLLKPNMVQYY